MTYDDYLDGTSKMAIQALVLELDEAVRGAAEKAVAPAVDQVHATLRRLGDSDEALRRELAELATRLPAHMQSLLEAVLRSASEPAWQTDLREAVQGGLSAQYERLSEAADAIRRLEGELATLARTVSHQGDQQEAGRARVEQVESGLVAAIARTEAALTQLGDASRHDREATEARLAGLLAARLEAAEAGQLERFRELAGVLQAVRDQLAGVHQHLGPAHQEQRERFGLVSSAIAALEARLGAVTQGVREAIGELQTVQAERLDHVDRALDRVESALGETREAALAAERAAQGSEDRLSRVEAAQARTLERLERTEESLLAGVLDREKRLSAEVRQIMREVVSEGVAPIVRQEIAPVGARLDQVESQLGQVREECQTRHDAVVRMLDNLNGRVVFDVEAQSKNAHLLDRLRRQGRWQMGISLVLLGAVALLFAFTFVERTGFFR
ncbi:MAG: hypothetical protein ACLGIN_05025 [Candidatus Sericytochromatia bacterium]